MSIKNDLLQLNKDNYLCGLVLDTNYNKYLETEYILLYKGVVVLKTTSEHTCINFYKGFLLGVNHK